MWNLIGCSDSDDDNTTKLSLLTDSYKHSLFSDESLDDDDESGFEVELNGNQQRCLYLKPNSSSSSSPLNRLSDNNTNINNIACSTLPNFKTQSKNTYSNNNSDSRSDKNETEVTETRLKARDGDDFGGDDNNGRAVESKMENFDNDDDDVNKENDPSSQQEKEKENNEKDVIVNIGSIIRNIIADDRGAGAKIIEGNESDIDIDVNSILDIDNDESDIDINVDSILDIDNDIDSTYHALPNIIDFDDEDFNMLRSGPPPPPPPPRKNVYFLNKHQRRTQKRLRKLMRVHIFHNELTTLYEVEESNNNEDDDYDEYESGEGESRHDHNSQDCRRSTGENDSQENSNFDTNKIHYYPQEYAFTDVNKIKARWRYALNVTENSIEFIPPSYSCWNTFEICEI